MWIKIKDVEECTSESQELKNLLSDNGYEYEDTMSDSEFDDIMYDHTHCPNCGESEFWGGGYCSHCGFSRA